MFVAVSKHIVLQVCCTERGHDRTYLGGASMRINLWCSQGTHFDGIAAFYSRAETKIMRQQLHSKHIYMVHGS
jgi:predicted esterase